MNISQRLKDAEHAHRNGQLEIAQQQYEAILTLENNTDALYGLGTVFMQKKLFSQAISLLKSAAKNEPNAADIAYNLALCLFNNKEHDESLKIIEDSINIALSDSTIAVAFAQLAMNLNAPNIVISLLKENRHLTDHGKNILATAYMKEMSWGEAKALWVDLSDKHPNATILFHQLSICATKLGQNQLAIDAYKKVISLEPTANNFIKFADLFLIIHDCSAARVQLNIAIELGDTSVARYEIECKICRLENNKTGIKKAVENVLKEKSDSYIAWQALQELDDAEVNKTCITKLTDLLDNSLEPSFETQQNLFTLAKALEKETLFKQAFERFKQANDLQYSRQSQNGNEYQPLQIERQYQRLQSINYPKLQHTKRPSNIFVVGMPRSGTTLINRLLSQPKHTKSCNESNAAAIAFERDLFNEEVSSEVVAKRLANEAERYYQKYQENNHINADVVIDKMPHNFRFVGAILSTFPNAKIIQMRRASQDLALSIYSQQFHEYHNYACQLPTIAHAIAQANHLMNHWRNRFPEQVIDIDYQAFVKDPVSLGKQLFNFCDIAWHDDYLSFYKTAVPSYTFSEVQVRKPINTSKIAFSKHYNDEFAEFRRLYASYYP